MSSLITKAIVEPSSGTASAWTTNDPVLNQGEIGYETDTGYPSSRMFENKTGAYVLYEDFEKYKKIVKEFITGVENFVGVCAVIAQHNCPWVLNMLFSDLLPLDELLQLVFVVLVEYERLRKDFRVEAV